MKHELAPCSPLFTSQVESLRVAAQLGPVVDLACGRGRHTLAAASAGLSTIGVDRNVEFLGELGRSGACCGVEIARARVDLETEHALPFADGSVGAVLVFRFLFRPLCADITRVLAPGGLLLYETFTTEQLTLGTGPKNPRFLLQTGELPQLFPDLRVLTHEEGFVREPGDDSGPPTAATARLAAQKKPRGSYL